MDKQSVHEILKEAFEKILKEHGLAVRYSEFTHLELLDGDVKLAEVTVNAKAVR